MADIRERPILFSGAMVRAILEGRKTQTRRVVKGLALDWLNDARFTPGYVAARANGLCPFGYPGDRLWVRETWQQVHPLQVAKGRHSTPGRAGIPGPPPVDYRTIYRADGEFPPIYSLGGEPWPFRSLEPFERNGMSAFVDQPRWTPSIHMPRWACRLVLEVTDVRIERLQDISEEDAVAEGCRWVGTSGGRDFYSAWTPPPGVRVDTFNPSGSPSAREAFDHLWASINGTESLLADPWVWVVSFRRAG